MSCPASSICVNVWYFQWKLLSRVFARHIPPHHKHYKLATRWKHCFSFSGSVSAGRLLSSSILFQVWASLNPGSERNYPSLVLLKTSYWLLRSTFHCRRVSEYLTCNCAQILVWLVCLSAACHFWGKCNFLLLCVFFFAMSHLCRKVCNPMTIFSIFTL